MCNGHSPSDIFAILPFSFHNLVNKRWLEYPMFCENEKINISYEFEIKIFSISSIFQEYRWNIIKWGTHILILSHSYGDIYKNILNLIQNIHNVCIAEKKNPCIEK